MFYEEEEQASSPVVVQCESRERIFAEYIRENKAYTRYVHGIPIVLHFTLNSSPAGKAMTDLIFFVTPFYLLCVCVS